MKKWINKSHVNVSELSRIVGVSRPTIYLWFKKFETGETLDNSVHGLMKLVYSETNRYIVYDYCYKNFRNNKDDSDYTDEILYLLRNKKYDYIKVLKTVKQIGLNIYGSKEELIRREV